MQTDDILFWRYDWHTVAEGQKQSVRTKIENLSPAELERFSVDELSSRLAEEFALAPPTLEVESIEVSQSEAQIDVSRDLNRHFREPGPHYIKGTAIHVRIPFTGDRQMFLVRPTSYNLNPPRASVGTGFLEFTIKGVDLTPERVRAEIDARVRDIAGFLENQAKSVGNFPSEIQNVARAALQQRLNKIGADKNLIAGLGYKVRTT